MLIIGIPKSHCSTANDNPSLIFIRDCGAYCEYEVRAFLNSMPYFVVPKNNVVHKVVSVLNSDVKELNKMLADGWRVKHRPTACEEFNRKEYGNDNTVYTTLFVLEREWADD